MPGSVVYPLGTPGVPLSRRELRKKMSHNPLYEFLDNLASSDVEYFFTDFGGKALDTTNEWTVAAGAGATTWAMLANGQNGRLRGVTGATAATSGLQLSRPANYLSAQYIGIEAGFYASNVTAKRYEIGFVNALPAVNTAVVNSLTTPTFNTVTDGAVYVFDNTAATNTSELATISSVASGQANKAVASPSQLVVAATFQRVRLELKGNNAFLWVNGALVAQQTGSGAASAVNPATFLLPCVSVLSGDTNSGNVDLDYVRLYSDRLSQT